MSNPVFDVAVVGGGIHGVSMAVEAADRGLKTLLIQGSDLGFSSHPGMQSLVSGDLRNLERLALYDLVRNFREQRRLRAQASHYLRPQRYFVIPNPSVRSASRVRWGLSVYCRLTDKLCKEGVNVELASQALVSPLPEDHGYTDYCATENRLIIALALLARSLGAEIQTYCRLTQATRGPRQWQLTLTKTSSKTTQSNTTPANTTSTTVSARHLINCTGNKANQVLDEILHVRSRCRVKSVHCASLLLPKSYPGDHGYIVQMADGQLLYSTPIHDSLVQLGPLIVDTNVAPEILFDRMQQAYSGIFRNPTMPDIKAADTKVQRFLLERAVYEDPCENANSTYLDSLLDLNASPTRAPLLNVFGTNLVQYRQVAEHGLDILAAYTGKKKNKEPTWKQLPGCQYDGSLTNFKTQLQFSYPNLAPELLNRLADTYGELAFQLLGNRQIMAELGQHLGDGIYTAELDYGQRFEWVTCAEDFLLRRTNLGLCVAEETVERIQQKLAAGK